MAGRAGRTVTKRLHAATREAEARRSYVAHPVRLARQKAVKLQRG